MNGHTVRYFSLFALIAFFSYVACDSAYGKKGGGKSKDPAPPKVSSVTLWGTIQSLQPDGSGLKIMAGTTAKVKNPKEWLVKPQSNIDVTIEGTATLDYVTKGKLVEFTAEVINKDHVDGKLSELTVVDKNTSQATETGAKKKSNSVNTGVGGRIEAPKDDDTAADGGKAGKQPAEAAIVAPGTKTTVTGKIVTKDDKKITIASKGQLIKVELSDVPTIKVRLSDPKLVHSGAKIEVMGTGAQSKQGNVVEAKTIIVTLSEPLSGAKTASSSSAKKLADK